MSGDHINRPDLYPGELRISDCKHTRMVPSGTTVIMTASPFECVFCALEKARSEVFLLKAAREQLEVQLAGCSVAALGWSRGDQKAEKGAYGWSQSYQDVVDLRERWEAGNAELARMRGALEQLFRYASEPADQHRDWACAECRPDSDMLVDGFRCGYHGARAILSPGNSAPKAST